MTTLRNALSFSLIATLLALLPGMPTLEARSIGGVKYGICNLATIPLRATGSHKSEAVTYLIFGEAYSVSQATPDGEWLEVQAHDDHYLGWIPANQFKEVTKEYFRQYRETLHPVVTAPISQLVSAQGMLLVSIGSVLPFYENGEVNVGGERYTVQDPAAVGPALPGSRDLLRVAQQYLHAPYLWGGKSIFGIDCSGFVQQVYKTASQVYLPRDAYQQAVVGQEVPWHAARPGDLAFFKNSKGRIVHVGIIMPNHRIIHASGKVRIDKFTPEGIYVEDQGVHSHQLAFVRRPQ
jgi:cell wall-associated NlpC family hydrolase